MPRFNLFESQDLFELFYLILTWDKKAHCREKNIITELNLIRVKEKRKPIKQTTLNNQLRYLIKKNIITFRFKKLGDKYWGPYIHKQFKQYIITRSTQNSLLNILIQLNYKNYPTEFNRLFLKEKQEKENIYDLGLDADYLSAKQVFIGNLNILFDYFLKKLIPNINNTEQLNFSKLKVHFEHFLLINWIPIHKDLISKLSNTKYNNPKYVNKEKDWFDLFEKVFIHSIPYFKEFIVDEKQIHTLRVKESRKLREYLEQENGEN